MSSIFSARRAAWEKSRDAGSSTAAKQTIFVRVMGTPSLTRKVRQAAYPLVRGCLTELETATRRPLQAEKMPFARGSAWRFRPPISLAGAWRHEQLMPPTAGASRYPPAQSPRTSRYGHRWRSEEHTSELQSRQYLVCRLL